METNVWYGICISIIHSGEHDVCFPSEEVFFPFIQSGEGSTRQTTG